MPRLTIRTIRYVRTDPIIEKLHFKTTLKSKTSTKSKHFIWISELWIFFGKIPDFQFKVFIVFTVLTNYEDYLPLLYTNVGR